MIDVNVPQKLDLMHDVCVGILKQMSKEGACRPGGVNWARFSINSFDIGHRVELIRSGDSQHDTDSYFFVKICNCSPDASDLRELVYSKLSTAGISAVVTTEW